MIDETSKINYSKNKNDRADEVQSPPLGRLVSSPCSALSYENMYRGYVKLWRKEKDWAFSRNPLAVALWVFLLREANHAITRREFKSEIIDILPGQLLTGRKYISIETGISESSVERLLKKFEIEQQLTQQKSNKNRLISITNWARYNPNTKCLDNKKTTDGQQKDTPKNVYNDKNDNKRENTEPSAFTYLQNQSFKDSWNSWLEVRKKLRAPNTNKALELSLKKLHNHHIDTAIEMLNQSIERGWRGLFEPKGQSESKQLTDSEKIMEKFRRSISGKTS